MTTVSDLDGLFKSVYAKKLVNLVPDALYIQRMTPLEQAQKIGKSYEFPVLLRAEQGVTYAGASAGAFTLNSAASMITQNAVVDGAQLVVRGTLDYESAAKATTGGVQAFVGATKLQVKSLYDNARNRLEIANIYGQSDGGIGAAASSVNIGATSTTVTFTDTSWAAGIWAAQEGSSVDAYEAGSQVGSAAFVVSSVDSANKAAVLTGASGDITALDAAIGGGSGDVVFYFEGAFGTEQVGLDAIITNTGTLFSIDASTYGLWRGNTFDAGTASLTFELVNTANSAAVARGLDEGATVLVSPSNWNTILNDQTALRQYDRVTRTMENGAEAIQFRSQNGTLDFVAHKFVKDGDVFIVPMGCLHRIGAQEVSFEIPGAPGQIFRHLDDAAGYEFRCYSNQAVICDSPAKMTKMTNFT